jgi:hypothetical protein
VLEVCYEISDAVTSMHSFCSNPNLHQSQGMRVDLVADLLVGLAPYTPADKGWLLADDQNAALMNAADGSVCDTFVTLVHLS